jgi:fructose/tagatose bisphosphate aldolase
MESWAIIAIVAILASFIGDIYKRVLSSKNEIGSRVEAELGLIRGRLEKLESTLEKRDIVQRLNALEAIVTDGKFELNRQIEGL